MKKRLFDIVCFFHYNGEMETTSKIKALMKERKVSQLRLAEMIGSKNFTVSRWFERKSIPLKYIKPIATALEVEVGELF